jgi:predicted signal transduction protein with EAL and GGDEF domain
MANRPPWIANRVIAALALMLAVAMFACALYARHLAAQVDRQLDMRQRQTAYAAVAALQEITAEHSPPDERLMRPIERLPDVGGLRFRSDPPKDSPQTQSLLDGNGRIVGWFTWEIDHPGSTIIERLSPFLVLISGGLLLLLGTVFWTVKRLQRHLAKTRARLERLTDRDPLTGLLSGSQLAEVLEWHLSDSRSHGAVGLLVIEFGGLDESDGHSGSADEDELLLEVASRLRSVIPLQSAIARLRGARFACVIPAADPEEVIAIAGSVRDSTSRPFWIERVIQMTPNLGLAIAPRDGMSRSELMQRAHLALRASGNRGGVVVSFNPAMAADFDEKRFIKGELAKALAARVLDVHYQPIVRADTGAINGIEALARWNHPGRGWISPGVFVRVAEEAGLIDQLTEFVLRRAIADAARWPGLYVTINVSPVQIRDRRFVEFVAEVLGESRFPPSRVVLEITESVLIDDPDSAKSRLEELRALGVKLAIDDFGAGYSSLAYLQRLPFDKLKIDQGFVAALEHSANAGVIVQAIVTLGHALGLTVVVEGVETEEQRVLMRLAGCSEMQGFLFAKPMPREEIDRLLREPALELGRAV